MKKPLHKTLCRFAILAMSGVFPLTASATRMLDDNFNYNLGDLYNQGNWLKYTTTNTNPIQVVDEPLTYTGYADVAQGKAAHLQKVKATTQKLFKLFTADGTNGITSGTLYYSALINVKQPADEQNYFINFVTGSKAGLADGKSSSDMDRVFAYTSANAGKFILGISKNGASYDSNGTIELNLNETYLLVVKHVFVEGTANDEMSYFINPVCGGTEPTANYTVSKLADPSATYGFVGLMLRQGGSTTKSTPEVVIDQVRVADSWADLFAAGDEPVNPDPVDPVDQPSLTLSASKIAFGNTYRGLPVTKTVNIKGQNLTGPVTFGTTASGQFSFAPASVAADDVMSANGADVTVTFSATVAGSTDETVSVTTDGLQNALSLQLTGNVEDVTSVASSQFVFSNTDESKLYCYEGQAVVTHVQGNIVYAQDIVGGICVDFSMSGATIPAVGDKITRIYYQPYFQQGMPTIYAYTGANILSHGNVKEPVVVTAKNYLLYPQSYCFRLITIENVDFGSAAGGNFGTSAVKGTDGDTEVTVLPFANTDLVGTAVPAKASVTGIGRSLAIASLSPRNAADLVAVADEASLQIACEPLFTGDVAPINVATPFAKYTVTATGMTAEGSVYLTGTNAAMFAVDKAVIPEGNSVTEFTVTYTPTAVGRHSARLNFDAVPVSASEGVALAAMAYDPSNPPAITADASALTAFAAEVGQTQAQTLAVTTANLVDYGTAKFTNPTGAFKLNTGSLLRTGQTQLTITFAPIAAGTYTDEIELSAVGAQSITFTVTGTATGSAPAGEKEGQDLAYDTTNPMALMIEPFDNVTRNKPLVIDRWVNAAVTGNRAWWGYTDGEPVNGMAKVTGYDMTVPVGSETDCQMMLLTPPLAFAAAAEPLLTFDITGAMLSDAMTDRLEVCYVDPTDPADIYIEPIAGLNIPATSDYNNTVVPYTIDLKGQQIADPFFIAFRFTSKRGKENSAVYYVDNVSWGRADLLFIRPAVKEVDLNCETAKTSTTQVHVDGLNLTAPIQLSIGGANASHFSLDCTEVPAEGGDFNVTFAPSEVGQHEAYVQLSSNGAPVSEVQLRGSASEPSGVADIAVGDAANDGAVYYNLQGMQVKHPSAGIYIRRQGTQITKVTVK